MYQAFIRDANRRFFLFTANDCKWQFQTLDSFKQLTLWKIPYIMETVKINDIEILIDLNQSYFEIADHDQLVLRETIQFINIDQEKQNRMLFLGFFGLDEKINNISKAKLHEFKSIIKGNNALQLIYSIIMNSFEYDIFFISTNGIDPMGIAFLKTLPQAFLHLNKKLFIIGWKTHNVEFKLNV